MDTSSQTQEMPAQIRGFLEDLLTQSGITPIDEQMKEEMLKDLFQRLDKFLASKIVQNLTDADLEVFMKMNEEGKPQEDIDAFLKEHMPNAQEVFANAFGEFRDLYVSSDTTQK